MTGLTPGQAFHASLTASQAGRFEGYEAVPWDDLADEFRADIETAAKDAVEAARLRQPEELREAMAETRQLREQLAAMTARWKDQAAMHDRDADRTGSRIESAALAAKSRVYTGNADEVLEVAGGLT